MKNLKTAFILFVILSIQSVAANAQGSGPAKLFTISGAESAFETKTSVASVEERPITFEQPSVFSGNEREVLIPLFDGKNYTAELSSFENRSMEDRTWRGKIKSGVFLGDVILTFYKGYVSGLIYSPDAVYEIVPRDDVHMLVRLDQSLFPECGGGLESAEKVAVEQVVPEGTVPDSGDRIDVMVVYTTATKNFLGGDAQAQAVAQQAIDATNTAYINSGIRQRVRLVNSQEYLYTETTSASTDLSNLRNNSTIQAQRNTNNADLVAMLGEISGACGVGYLMGGAGGNQNNGYTVTARSCAVGNLSFAHELGHNMGSQHNPENGSGATYPYGYGHYVDGSYRTVMSYVNPCAAGCSRRPYFSNPGVIYLGAPTGLVDQRDNVRSINNTADVIANYRYSGSSILMSTFTGSGILPRGIRRSVNWQSSNISGNVRIELSRDGGLTWTTLIADTPNDGAENVTVWGQAGRRGRLRVASISSPQVTDSSTADIYLR